ncbi:MULTISPECIES: ABC transporter permease [Trichocoleus]|uniref:ABC transporter permease n=1 Tax=Trichocoleus desertorum GB2-A4 TaxID=2933944 RepID=A0ABV0J8X3_9CYAN|nr:ABC transporter permease [Trichocoleus sp. FACHB-46]MBD1864609.1 ABC transporter permease [Trichocoleus sp. FACHB-46]
MSLALADLLKLTCRSLAGNPLRSALTLLGVFMGVGAVYATLQVGNISRAIIAAELAKRDAPQITLYPSWNSRGDAPAQLKAEDMEFLRSRLTHLQAISAADWSGPAQVLFQDREANPFMTAVSQEFLLTSGRNLVAGRFFTAADFANYRPVVVIDQFLSEKLFAAQDAIGQRIYVDSRPYIVVGVVPTRTESEEPPEGEIWISIALHSALTGSQDVGGLRLRPDEIQNLENLGKQAEQLLMQKFPGKKFWAWNNVEDIVEQQQTLELASQALAVVGLISLLVGGVGIANIMIASVTERTAEIGLRRAIGATQQDILLQFVLEAAVLSVVGGVVALGMVHGLTATVAKTFKLPYQFESGTAALALGSAVLVGIGAGLPPALRASQLDPVKALRSE